MMRAGGSGSDASVTVSETVTVLPATSKRIPPKRFEVASVKLFQVTRAQYHKETTTRSSVASALGDRLRDGVSVPRHRALSQNYSPNHFGPENYFQEGTPSLQNHSHSIPTLINLTDEEPVPCLDSSDTAPPRGLRNIGNTCYQNAIVQTLYFNSDLRKYLALQHSRRGHESDGGQSVDRSKKVTKTLSELISNMASGSSTFISQHVFKSMVDSHMAQFHGRQQQDAQEFLLSLLNQLQEEVRPPPAVEASCLPHTKVTCVAPTVGQHGSGGFAEETSTAPLQQPAHKMQATSAIADMFQGSFCSQLQCPECDYCSAIFEPFTCLSLPIPKQDIHTIQVSIVYRRRAGLFSRTGSRQTFHINQSMTASELRAIVAKEMGMGLRDVILCDMVRSGFGVLLNDTALASEICSHRDLHAFEAPPFHGSPDQQPILLIVSNIMTDSAQASSGRRFGVPVVLRVRRNLTHMQFQSVLLHSMSSHLRDTSESLKEWIRKSVLFQCQIVTNDNPTGLGWLEDEGKGVFVHPSVQAGLLEANEHRLTPHVRVIAVWTALSKDSIFKAEVPDTLSPAPFSVATFKRREAYALTATLQDCIQHYIQEERLNDADWKCPNCSHTQRNVVKKLDFHTLPKTLMISIKRFDQIYNSVNGKTVESKLSTMVDFPIYGLDMTPYLPREGAPGGRPSEADPMIQEGKERSGKQKTSKSTGKTLWSKIKGARNWGKKSHSGVAPPPATVDVDTGLQAGEVQSTSSTPACNDSVISFTPADMNKYDLYAVVNHYGGLSRGHYTATCRDTTDGSRKWHHFDDSTVTAALERNLRTSNAYILCYTQRKAGMARVWSRQPSTCQERMSLATSCCTDYDVGDTCHFTIDAYSMSDVESWKSVTSLTQKMKVDSCLPASQQLHDTLLTTPSPQASNSSHTSYAAEPGRATGEHSGEEAVGVVRNGGGRVVELEGSPDSTSHFDTRSNHPPDLLTGPVQPATQQDAESKPGLPLDQCLDVQAPLLTTAVENGECTVPSASQPRVAWLSDSITRNLSREKLILEVRQPRGSEVDRNPALQPHYLDKPTAYVAAETLL